MKKRVCSILLVCLMLLSVTACGDKGTPVLHYDLPKEFSDQMGSRYYPAREYMNDPAEADTTFILIRENVEDLSLSKLKEIEYIEELEQVYEEGFNCKVEVECTEFTKSKLNGCRTLLIRSTFKLPVGEIEQIQYAVELGKNNVTIFSFAQPVGGSWTDTFEDCIDSISIEYVK